MSDLLLAIAVHLVFALGYLLVGVRLPAGRRLAVAARRSFLDLLLLTVCWVLPLTLLSNLCLLALGGQELVAVSLSSKLGLIINLPLLYVIVYVVGPKFASNEKD